MLLLFSKNQDHLCGGLNKSRSVWLVRALHVLMQTFWNCNATIPVSCYNITLTQAAASCRKPLFMAVFCFSAREDGPPQEPDESLIDECCLLPSQLLVPSMDWLPVNDGVIVRLQGKIPLKLQFGKASSLPGAGGGSPLEALTRY